MSAVASAQHHSEQVLLIYLVGAGPDGPRNVFNGHRDWHQAEGLSLGSL
jgi:hypothetical protein